MNWRRRLSQVRTVMGIMHGGRAFTGPFQARLSLSNRCNIRCIHCYFFSPFLEKPTSISLLRDLQVSLKPSDNGYGPSPKFDADTEKTRSLLKELLDAGTCQVLFSGRGEPFLHRNVLDLMGYAKRGGALCLINTNGTLLDPATINELLKMGFDELRITVMGGSREVYMRTHPGIGPETFDSLKENLLYLAGQKAARRVRKPKVTLVFIVVAQNHEGLFEFAEFAAGVSADRILYRPVDDLEDKGLSKLVLAREQSLHVRKQLVEVESYLEDKGISHNIKNFLRVFQQQIDTTELYRIIPCYYGWLSTMIEVDGTIYACCRCSQPLGNIYKEWFNKIWYGPSYERFRKSALHINARKSPVTGCDCNSCVNHEANSRAYQMLHPVKSRLTKR